MNKIKLLFKKAFLKLSYAFLFSLVFLPFQASGSSIMVEHVYDNTSPHNPYIFNLHEQFDVDKRVAASTHQQTPQKPYNQCGIEYVNDPQERTYKFNERVLQKVIPGKDGRARITKTTEWPYSVITKLKIFLDEDRYSGSGSLVGPYHVLTCGHNVYDFDNKKKWADKIFVYPALDDQYAPFRKVKVVKCYTFPSWISSGDRTHDVALLILAYPIGEYTGWMGLSSFHDNSFNQQNFQITGYPGDKGHSQMWSMGHQLKAVKPEILEYEIDTAPGQSGSPIWMNDQGVKIVGVHTCGSDIMKMNYGVRLTRAKLHKLLGIMASETYTHHFTVPGLGNVIEGGIEVPSYHRIKDHELPPGAIGDAYNKQEQYHASVMRTTAGSLIAYSILGVGGFALSAPLAVPLIGTAILFGGLLRLGKAATYDDYQERMAMEALTRRREWMQANVIEPMLLYRERTGVEHPLWSQIKDM